LLLDSCGAEIGSSMVVEVESGRFRKQAKNEDKVHHKNYLGTLPSKRDKGPLGPLRFRS